MMYDGWMWGHGYGPPRPADVLAGRFAGGEIDEDEYRRRVTPLHEHR